MGKSVVDAKDVLLAAEIPGSLTSWPTLSHLAGDLRVTQQSLHGEVARKIEGWLQFVQGQADSMRSHQPVSCCSVVHA